MIGSLTGTLVEKELQMYRTQMDALVEARVAELDEANEKLAVLNFPKLTPPMIVTRETA